jgi:predicted amino acid racemase
MDFLETTTRRNPKLIDAAFELHRDRKIPADTYLVDLASVERNSRFVSEAARKSGIKNYYMTKQFGRNPLISKAIVKGGIKSAVAINVDEAKILYGNGFKVDHVGNLIQIPSGDVEFILGKVRPEIITVFSFEKAREVDRAAKKFGIIQKIMLRPVSPSDSFIGNAEGGTSIRELVNQANRISSELKNVTVAGLTSFPSFRFDLREIKLVTTSNFESMMRAKSLIESETKVRIEQINAPGSNCAAGMEMMKKEGASHGEPGHAFTGTTPWHAFDETLPEVPAWVYVTEVSHASPDRAYSFSGGLPQTGYHGFFTMKYHQTFMSALAEKKGSRKMILAEPAPITLDNLAWPDYYTVLHQPDDNQLLEVSDTVVFGFRPQVYQTRSTVTVVKGIGTSNEVLGTFDRNGNLLNNEGIPASREELHELQYMME